MTMLSVRSLAPALAAALLLALTAGDAAAQRPDRGDRGGRRGGPPGGMMGGGMGGGVSMFALLKDANVRKDLELSDETVSYVNLIEEDVQTKRQAMMEKLRDGDRDDRRAMFEEMRESMAEQAKETQEQLAEIVGKDAYQRAEQISLQVQLKNQGMARTLSSPTYAEKLNVTDEQKQMLGEKMREAFQSMREGGGDGGGDREAMRQKMRERMETLRVEADKAFEESLSRNQKKMLAELTGDPIDYEVKLPQPEFGGGFGRGGGRGDRGAGRGQRPGGVIN